MVVHLIEKTSMKREVAAVEELVPGRTFQTEATGILPVAMGGRTFEIVGPPIECPSGPLLVTYVAVRRVPTTDPSETIMVEVATMGINAGRSGDTPAYPARTYRLS